MFPSSVDPLDTIAEALTALEAEADGWVDWSGPAQTERAVGLAQLHGRLEVLAARAAGTFEASGAWRADGSRQAGAALARRSGRGGATCARLLRVGALARDHEATGAALAAGDLPADHAAALAQAVRGREEAYPTYEAQLLDQARRLDLRRYRKVLELFRQFADEDLGRDNEARAHDQREFTLADLLDGVSALTGTAEAEGAAIIRAAIDRFTVLDPPDQPGPHRRAGQVRYDALIAALATALGAEVPGRAKRTIDAIVSLELLTGDDRRPPLDQARCELVGVGVVAPSLLRRLAAHSTIGRVIATAQGLPLDVGRRVHAFPRAHRRAIRFRDDTCVWPGCDLPGEWSDIDHAHAFHHGGPTAVTNGRFLCVRHHHLRHQGWTVHWDPTTGHSTVTDPHGSTHTSDPDPPPGTRPRQERPAPVPV